MYDVSHDNTGNYEASILTLQHLQLNMESLKNKNFFYEKKFFKRYIYLTYGYFILLPMANSVKTGAHNTAEPCS